MKLYRLFTIFCVALAALFIIEIPVEARKKTSTSQSSKSKKSSSSKSSRSSKSSKSSKSSSASSRRSKKTKGTSTSKSSNKTKRTRTYTRKRSTPTAAPDPVSYDSLTLLINAAVLDAIPADINPGGLRVNHVTLDKGAQRVNVGLNENFTYLPVSNESISKLQKIVSNALPDSIEDYRVNLNVGKRSLSYYISKIEQLPEKYRNAGTPIVREVNPVTKTSKGMVGDHIALWGSHGRYYKNGAWAWQRPMLFETMEDIYTSGYVLPYIVPMLENAGANVFLPRERDTNVNEVIVDHDTNPSGDLFSQTSYKESGHNWKSGEGDGFIYDLEYFRDTENPFSVGSYRQIETTTNPKNESRAGWYPTFPEDGEYAVYVSYKTLPESTKDALYTVSYSGGTKSFLVNQTMGGGTWIYLGTFPFKEGQSQVAAVSLSNLSKEAHKTVTADAVKFGGGMGNIERSPRRSDIYWDPSTPEKGYDTDDDTESVEEEGDDEEDDEEDDDDEEGGDDQGETDNSQSQQPSAPSKASGRGPVFRTSGLPRYLEGARYWLQWAGFPDNVYSPHRGSDDYKDDYMSRGLWVNYLAGGSRVLPKREGLNIPIDLSMALHSDAGKRADDSIIGTLGIYYTKDGANYADGTSRKNSRFLTDLIMRNISQDIRRTYEPRWTRRSMWDKSYAEAKSPEVPSALIELMSHQNFGDMQYGLDPNFRFLVGRSIYKAMARFTAERKDREVVIQPLPVKDFAIQPVAKKAGMYKLSWEPTPDPLEPSAMPTEYIVMMRNEWDLGFSVKAVTKNTHFEVKVDNDDIYSFQIIAANEGGRSFPSEILSLRYCEDKSKPTVLIVNGFQRVSAPSHFSQDGRAGFNSEEDFGVPYIKDFSFIGHQTEFRRSAGDGFGKSAGNYIGKVIAGNTFDYPFVHGEAIANAGYGFVSASAAAVEKGTVKLSDYKIVDLILGKQKATTVGKGFSGVNYRTFPKPLQKDIAKYLGNGGKLLISGQYVASDLLSDKGDEEDRRFARDVLGIDLMEPSAKSRSGKVAVIPTDMKLPLGQRSYSYSNTLNEDMYIVEQPDVIIPADGARGQVFMELTDTNDPVGIVSKKGNSKTVIMSVPYEAVDDILVERNKDQVLVLMAEILQYLNAN